MKCLTYGVRPLSTVVMHHQQRVAAAATCELLVSLMGFSPETTVLATVFVRTSAAGHRRQPKC
jgi:hypothetical protein